LFFVFFFIHTRQRNTNAVKEKKKKETYFNGTRQEVGCCVRYSHNAAAAAGRFIKMYRQRHAHADTSFWIASLQADTELWAERAQLQIS